MEKISNVINNFCNKYNIKRSSFIDKNLPTSLENVVVFIFFGDTRSSFILSSLLLRRIKEESKGSKYFVMLSWPGNEGLYPYVDEYWTIDDDLCLDKLANKANGFNNESSYYSLLLRCLHEWFYEIISYDDLDSYYHNGLTQKFLERFKNIKLSLPSINSFSSLGNNATQIMSKDLRVFIYPSKYYNYWQAGRPHKGFVGKDFWQEAINFLLNNNYYPIIYKDLFSYDMSLDFPNECYHFSEKNISKVLTLIRLSGFVIDYFNGISRLAICARTPYLYFCERNYYNKVKEYEIDDLCSMGLIKDYSFIFPDVLSDNNKRYWKSSVFDLTLNKLNKIIPNMNKDSLPTTIELDKVVPYRNVRTIKNKKLGTKFIKVKKEII